jgi:hypothetical protein
MLYIYSSGINISKSKKLTAQTYPRVFSFTAQKYVEYVYLNERCKIPA